MNAVHISLLLAAGCAPALRWSAPPPTVSVAVNDDRAHKDDKIGERPGAFGVPAAIRGDVTGTLRNLLGDAAARAGTRRPVAFTVEKLWCAGGYSEIRGRLGAIAVEVHETRRDCDSSLDRTLAQLHDLIVELLSSGTG